MIAHTQKSPDKPSTEAVDNSALLQSYKSFQMMMRIGIGIVIGLGFMYLIGLNSIATRGFDLEKVKIERMQVIKELEQIEINLAIPLSLYALQSSTQIQDMPTIEEKDYLYVQPGRLAKTEHVARR